MARAVVTAWAKPRDLLVAYRFASASEWRVHIETLKDWGYPYLPQLMKERARESSGVSKSSKAGADAGTD
jgi:hypothetical protein